MKKLLVLLPVLVLGAFVFGQQKQPSCKCPKKGFNLSGKADKVFDLGNGKQLGICGSIEKKKKDTLYSEFILFQCGQNKTIEEWDGTESCSITQKSDTLFISTFAGLPIGKNFEMVWVPFEIQQYFYRNTGLVDSLFYASGLPVYSAVQIKKVLSQYAKLTRENGDSILLVSHRLFWAYVSGSKEAEQGLLRMERKFGPFDGAIAEEFEEIRASYELYKDRHKGATAHSAQLHGN